MNHLRTRAKKLELNFKDKGQPIILCVSSDEEAEEKMKSIPAEDRGRVQIIRFYFDCNEGPL